jgi:hypothetical protein
MIKPSHNNGVYIYISSVGYLDWDVVWNICSNHNAYYHHS